MRYISFFVILTISISIYSASFPGFFIHDDFPNIVNKTQIQANEIGELAAAALSNDSGLLKRPISALSFALNYFIFKTIEPWHFKLVNIAIHLCNSLLLWLLLNQIIYQLETKNRAHQPQQYHWFVLIIFALWVLHPIHHSTVLYSVQRMVLFSALFTLTGLFCYLKFRTSTTLKSAALYLFGFITSLVLGLFSKENAALLPLYCLALEILLYKGDESRVNSKLTIFFTLFVVIPGITALYLVFSGDYLNLAYGSSLFSLEERLLTETRVLFLYLQQIILPSTELFRFIYVDFPLSQSLTNPWTTAAAILGLLALLVSGLLNRYIAVGVLFFLFGHLLESTIFPLELVYEHRNYLPSLGILFLVLLGLIKIKQFLSKKICVVIVGMYIGLNGFTLLSMVSVWSDYDIYLNYLNQTYPNTYATQYKLASIYYNQAIVEEDSDKLYQQAINENTILYAINNSSITPLLRILKLQSQFEDQKIDEQIIADVRRFFTFNPIRATDATTLIEMLKCQIEQLCQFTAGQVQTIFEPVLSSQKISAKVKSIILFELSRYFYYSLQNYQNALQLAFESVSVQQKPENTALLISMLYQLNQKTAAITQLDNILQDDYFGIKRQLYRQLFKDIPELYDQIN
ncbi:hypothetical protein D5085_07170 [Ectothiorhodospiraceae bacterium BW-2]|nr:hypothetical protein D5085_07170 [Ectothiorhodospiraceae bacterium BW-2]